MSVKKCLIFVVQRKKAQDLECLHWISRYCLSNLHPCGKQLGPVTERILIKSEARCQKALSKTQTMFTYLKKLDNPSWAWRLFPLGHTYTLHDRYKTLRGIARILVQEHNPMSLNTTWEHPLRRATVEKICMYILSWRFLICEPQTLGALGVTARVVTKQFWLI